ncbi:MAG: FAD-dependent oxidoreductase [Burkholderiales bacterium]|nr:FAD-dependent oxidoreductase [Burkholderiales bacterium]
MRADVVVVGGGGSGLAAAVEAAANGARVVVLEKNPSCGGTTARSIGSISATGTPHQMRRGIVDTPESHYRDMTLFAQHVGRGDNDALRRVLTENVPQTLRWLGHMGIEFFGPLEELPHTKPRMHNVLPNSRAYIFHLERRARALGVRILKGASALELRHRDARIVGVEAALCGGGPESIDASRGVVLAAGDYAANPDMKRALISAAVADIEAVNPTSTGDGIRLGLAAGGRIVNPDLFGGGIRFVRPARPSWVSRVPPWRSLMRATNFLLERTPPAIVRRFVMGFLTTVLVPELKLFADGAIVVNGDGERFADEALPMMYALAQQAGGCAYIVFDAALAGKYSRWPHYLSTAPGFAYAYLGDYLRNRPDLVRRAASLETLAQRIGARPERLLRTVRAYNDSDSAVPPRGARPIIGDGPYYALGPVKSYVNYTDGGLAVNDELQVLGLNDVPIRGLYAAGSNGQGGLLLKGHGHHLGWAFTSGRIAGRNAARDAAAP